jgi:tetratricopeptide (TPR) repeat protein
MQIRNIGKMMKKIFFNNNFRNRRFARYAVTVVAGLALLFLGVEGYNFYRLSPGRLFAEKYLTYKLPEITDKAAQQSKIEKAYREKNFSEVIRLNAISVVYAKDIFLTGLAYLETEDESRAIGSFQVVLADTEKDKTSALKDATEYYLALAYLKNRDFDQAIELMSSIHNNISHVYKDRFSMKFIRKVKRLKWR